MRLRTLLLTVGLAAALTACGLDDTEPGSGGSDGFDKVLIGTSGESAGTQLAYNIARGQEGIEVEEVQVNGAPLILQALINDQANVGFLSLSTALQGREHGKNIKLGAAVQITNDWTPIISLAYLKKKGIDPAAFVKLPVKERLAQVKGSTWAVNAAGGLYERATVYLVGHYGLDPERDIEIVPLDQVSQVAGIKDGTVNVWLASPPNNRLLVEQGHAVDLVTHDEIVKELPLIANARSAETIINDDWASRNSDVAKRFFKAYQRGADFVVTHSVEEIIASLKKVYPDLSGDRLAAIVKANKENTPKDSRHSTEAIQAQIEFAVASRNIKRSFTVDEAYTDAYLPVARS
jgi:NitT/TauT family transport system substrate-binding protein